MVRRLQRWPLSVFHNPKPASGLKKEFNRESAAKEKFEELAKQFVLTNTEDDEEPEDEKYAPDGAYIPRIIFLGKLGCLLLPTAFRAER